LDIIKHFTTSDEFHDDRDNFVCVAGFLDVVNSGVAIDQVDDVGMFESGESEDFSFDVFEVKVEERVFNDLYGIVLVG